MAVEYAMISHPAAEAGRLEEILNKRAAVGWRVVGFTTFMVDDRLFAGTRSLVGPPGAIHYVILERQTD